MDTNKAHHIINEVAQLVEWASTFQARYGQDYRMKPLSSEDAWTLYQNIFDAQSRIARMLDIDTLENPYEKWGAWWEKRDIIDTGMLSQLSCEVFHLLSYCAAHEAQGSKSEFPLIARIRQQIIAGMLHPGARQLGLDREAQVG